MRYDTAAAVCRSVTRQGRGVFKAWRGKGSRVAVLEGPPLTRKQSMKCEGEKKTTRGTTDTREREEKTPESRALDLALRDFDLVEGVGFPDGALPS